MSYSGANSSQVVQDGQRSQSSVPHTPIAVLVAILILAVFVGGLGTFAVLRFRAPRANATPTTVSSTHVTSAVVVKTAEPRAVPVDALPTTVPSNMTVVTFERSPISHRVWIDDVLAGSDDEPMKVRCGRRTIKIGSQGKARSVDLPCGGEVRLRP